MFVKYRLPIHKFYTKKCTSFPLYHKKWFVSSKNVSLHKIFTNPKTEHQFAVGGWCRAVGTNTSSIKSQKKTPLRGFPSAYFCRFFFGI